MQSYLGWKIDFEHPAGARAYCGPDSVSWRVFKNPVALGIGGVAAVLLEFADARIRSGVWDHSTYPTDPIGRSQRTGMAAMVGVYAPQAVARRIIQGVTNMHAKVEGKTPNGEAYRALDKDLLDWVSATAAYGFLHAYDRFVAPLKAEEKRAFYQEGDAVARLYGVQRPVHADEDFFDMMERLAPRFEPHPIIEEFLQIVESGPGAIGVPLFVRRAMARASASLLPEVVRAKIGLPKRYALTATDAVLLRTLGALADRIAPKDAPCMQACRRMGLPGDFLYRSRAAQARIMASWSPAEDANALAAE